MSDRLRCITRVQGGLGNQLFCYAHGRAVAARLDADLVLDISELSRGDLYGRRFELEHLGVHARTMASSWLAGPVGRVTRPILRMARRDRIYREPRSPRPGEHVSGWVYLDGYWQVAPALGDQQTALQAEIRVMPQRLSGAASALARRLSDERAIGVHVRSYREEVVASRRATPGSGYFTVAIERIFAEFGPRTIYVASDAKVPLELPPPLAERLINAGGVYSQLEDLHLLRSCAYHVLSNSSFGWWSAYLAGSARTYYPAQAGYFHYPQPAPGWRLLADPAAG